MTKETEFKCERPGAIHPVHGPCVEHSGFFHLGKSTGPHSRAAWPDRDIFGGGKKIEIKDNK